MRIEKSNSDAAILSVAEVLDLYTIAKGEKGYSNSEEYWKRS